MVGVQNDPDTWYAFLPASPALEYLVQVVDGAGNVTVDDNVGLYHPMSDTHRVHLPLVLRYWPQDQFLGPKIRQQAGTNRHGRRAKPKTEKGAKDVNTRKAI